MLSTEKKQPTRRCVGCTTVKNKKELIRVLRTPEEEFVIDVTGKKNGRGAYICKDINCFKKAVKNKGLERSFKMAIDESVYESLEKELESLDE